MNKIYLMLFLIYSVIGISCTTSSTSSENQAPIARFTVTRLFGNTFTFDASGCTDEEDPTAGLQVRWDWENNGTYDTGWDTTKITTHQYPSLPIWAGAGDFTFEYTVLLEVKDSGGLIDSATVEVSIGYVPPELDLSINTFYK